MKQPEEEPLMNLRPKTDFEKLLWANNRIKELEKQLEAVHHAMLHSTELLEEVNETLRLNGPKRAQQILTLKSENSKLKTKYNELLYKHSLLQIKFNSLNINKL